MPLQFAWYIPHVINKNSILALSNRKSKTPKKVEENLISSTLLF
jgi:hypothetical protein